MLSQKMLQLKWDCLSGDCYCCIAAGCTALLTKSWASISPVGPYRDAENLGVCVSDVADCLHPSPFWLVWWWAVRLWSATVWLSRFIQQVHEISQATPHSTAPQQRASYLIFQGSQCAGSVAYCQPTSYGVNPCSTASHKVDWTCSGLIWFILIYTVVYGGVCIFRHIRLSIITLHTCYLHS